MRPRAGPDVDVLLAKSYVITPGSCSGFGSVGWKESTREDAALLKTMLEPRMKFRWFRRLSGYAKIDYFE